jgi:hypothetical protein
MSSIFDLGDREARILVRREQTVRFLA